MSLTIKKRDLVIIILSFILIPIIGALVIQKIINKASPHIVNYATGGMDINLLNKLENNFLLKFNENKYQEIYDTILSDSGKVGGYDFFDDRMKEMHTKIGQINEMLLVKAGWDRKWEEKSNTFKVIYLLIGTKRNALLTFELVRGDSDYLINDHWLEMPTISTEQIDDARKTDKSLRDMISKKISN